MGDEMFLGYLILGAIGGTVAAAFMLIAGCGVMAAFLAYTLTGAALTIAVAAANCIAAKFFGHRRSGAAR